ncbi:hypothetical protein GGI07_004849 [Coemansia sp. Benny D115]|nr:hypothetical protein GGI07_004849 [Coemansia sp. Benny D115]
MRGLTLYRLFVAVALALFCLVSVSTAQDQGDEEASTTPTRTTSTNTRSTSRNTSSSRSSSTNATNKDDEQTGEIDDEKEPTEDEDENSNDENNDDEDDDSAEPTESFDEEFEATGWPGRFVLTTPDVTAYPTPMFVIGEEVTLAWKFEKEVVRPPKKVSICGKFPRDSNKSKDRTAYCDWDIAVNLTGGTKKFIWDTLTVGAPGVVFSEDTGYIMIFYDSDYGPGNQQPGAGRAIPYTLTFNMYRSKYGSTNQGVPVGYDPSAAPSVSVHLWTIVGAVALSVMGMLA